MNKDIRSKIEEEKSELENLERIVESQINNIERQKTQQNYQYQYKNNSISNKSSAELIGSVIGGGVFGSALGLAAYLGKTIITEGGFHNFFEFAVPFGCGASFLYYMLKEGETLSDSWGRGILGFSVGGFAYNILYGIMNILKTTYFTHSYEKFSLPSPHLGKFTLDWEMFAYQLIGGVIIGALSFIIQKIKKY